MFIHNNRLVQSRKEMDVKAHHHYYPKMSISKSLKAKVKASILNYVGVKEPEDFWLKHSFPNKDDNERK